MALLLHSTSYHTPLGDVRWLPHMMEWRDEAERGESDMLQRGLSGS